MRAIFNRSTDPYFNIASDEFLLRTTRSDAIMIWRNSASVIIGKNQNAWAEVDVPFVTENSIPVVRRITGGGAVFHDLGNVNFSFVTPATEDTKLNFEKFTRPVIEVLRKFGVNASLDGRNDIVADGFKISGNAECVITNDHGEPALLHHGTLLFSADLSRLGGALRVDPEKLKSKGVKSAPARVKNISAIAGYSGPESVEEFAAALIKEFAPDSAKDFSDEEKAKIRRLSTEKFSTWDWNFGASPSFGTENKQRFPYGTVSVSIDCRAGRIERIKFSGDFFGSRDIEKLEKLMTGIKFDRVETEKVLTENRALLEGCIFGASPEDISSLITKG